LAVEIWALAEVQGRGQEHSPLIIGGHAKAAVQTAAQAVLAQDR
jgi:hypothetical protein